MILRRTPRVVAGLLVVGLSIAGLGVASDQTDRLPTSKLVVQAMHTTWPDGSPVESGGANYPTDIYVVDADGKHIRTLTHDDPTNYLIGWLSRSNTILYENVPSDRMRRRGRSQIFSIKLDGSGRRELASGNGELLPEPSPDGRRILFGRGRWLYVMQSDGTHKRPLTQTSVGYYDPPGYGPYDASWSRDGKRVAFVRGFAKERAYGSGKNPRSALYVINADGTGLRRLTGVRPRVETMNPAWSPDGSKIAFDEYRYPANLSNRTYVIHADGTHVAHLKPLDAYGEQEWFWLSSDRIAYPVENGRLRTIAADGTGRPRALHGRIRIDGHVWLTSGPQAGSLRPVSPDGRWIAFAATMRALSIAHVDGTHVRRVTRKICCFFWEYRVEWAGK